MIRWIPCTKKEVCHANCADSFLILQGAFPPWLEAREEAGMHLPVPLLVQLGPPRARSASEGSAGVAGTAGAEASGWAVTGCASCGAVSDAALSVVLLPDLDGASLMLTSSDACKPVVHSLQAVSRFALTLKPVRRSILSWA